MNPDENKKDATPPAPPAPPEKPKNQKARVLGGFRLDGIDYQPNDVIEANADVIQSLGSSVDVDADAIAQAIKNEQGIVKKHPSK